MDILYVIAFEEVLQCFCNKHNLCTKHEDVHSWSVAQDFQCSTVGCDVYVSQEEVYLEAKEALYWTNNMLARRNAPPHNYQ